MATLLIEDFPDALSERLMDAARRRGVTPAAFVIERIDRDLQPLDPLPTQMTEADLMAAVADVRAGFVGPAFTPEELEAAIDEGRP